MPVLTIYYDGSCPLCRREIAFYKGNPDAVQLHWHDVSLNVLANDDSSLGEGLSCERAMAYFHVRDAQGNLFEGGAAFARLWLELRGWRWAGRVFSVWPFSWAIKVGYKMFLPIRPTLQKYLLQWDARHS
jgi:predicted DCC family thiol-disulfide oxidoreductase YuxK